MDGGKLKMEFFALMAGRSAGETAERRACPARVSCVLTGRYDTLPAGLSCVLNDVLLYYFLRDGNISL